MKFDTLVRSFLSEDSAPATGQDPIAALAQAIQQNQDPSQFYAKLTPEQQKAVLPLLQADPNNPNIKKLSAATNPAASQQTTPLPQQSNTNTNPQKPSNSFSNSNAPYKTGTPVG